MIAKLIKKPPRKWYKNISVKYAYLSFPYRCTYLPCNKIGSNVASKHIYLAGHLSTWKTRQLFGVDRKGEFLIWSYIPEVCQKDTIIRNWLVDLFQGYLIFLHNSLDNKYCWSVLNGKYLQFVSDSVATISNLYFLFLFRSLLSILSGFST